MTITKKQEGASLELALAGRLDTMTSPELKAVLDDSLDGVTALTFDFAGLDYISSAGLRVLLTTQKTMNHQGSMKLVHVKEAILEILEVTGITKILTIERENTESE